MTNFNHCEPCTMSQRIGFANAKALLNKVHCHSSNHRIAPCLQHNILPSQAARSSDKQASDVLLLLGPPPAPRLQQAAHSVPYQQQILSSSFAPLPFVLTCHSSRRSPRRTPRRQPFHSERRNNSQYTPISYLQRCRMRVSYLGHRRMQYLQNW